MKITKILNCTFTTEELKEIGIKLALENQSKERLEDKKKQAMSQFKSEIDAADAKIKSLAQKLARGSEDREIECDILFNTPEEGKKTTVRNDTGEIVQVQDMTKEELADLFINQLGARKDFNEFVFRDKSRAKLISFENFNELQRHIKASKKKDIIEKIADGMTEEELVDNKPEAPVEALLVVYDLDRQTGKDLFEVWKFNMQLETSEPKMLESSGEEVIDADVETEK